MHLLILAATYGCALLFETGFLFRLLDRQAKYFSVSRFVNKTFVRVQIELWIMLFFGLDHHILSLALIALELEDTFDQNRHQESRCIYPRDLCKP